MIRRTAAVNLKQRSEPAWRRNGRGSGVAVQQFLLRQLHIQATPQLYPPEFTGLNNCDQGASWARPAFSTSRHGGLGFVSIAACAGTHTGLN
jgi:hypothetical protein